jgi:WD40 repeat protein
MWSRTISLALILLLLAACAGFELSPVHTPASPAPASSQTPSKLTPDSHLVRQSTAQDLAETALAELENLNYDRALLLAREAVLVTWEVDGFATDQADAALREVLITILFEDRIRAIAWSADGAQIVTTHGSGATRLWDAQSGQLLQKDGVKVNPDEWRSNNAQYQVSTVREGDTLYLYDEQSNQLLYTLQDPERVIWEYFGYIRYVILNPDRSRMITVSDDGIRIWDTLSGRYLHDLGYAHYRRIGYIAGLGDFMGPWPTPLPVNLRGFDVDTLLAFSEAVLPASFKATPTPDTGHVIIVPITGTIIEVSTATP